MHDLAGMSRLHRDRVPPHKSRWQWMLAGVVVGLLLVPRLVGIERDAPTHVVTHYQDESVFRDEVAKAHEARNMARFGQWGASGVDGYHFWRRQSPYWVYAETTWFRIFGVSYIAARAFVLAHVLPSLVVFGWMLWVRAGFAAAIAGSLLLGTNWAYLIFSRLALMEAVVIAWLTIASCGMLQLERGKRFSPLWTGVAVLGALAACMTKQTGLLLMPAFVAHMVWLARKKSGRAKYHIILSLVVFAAILIGFVLLPGYEERLTFNAKHYTRAQGDAIRVVAQSTHTVLRGITGNRLWLLIFVFAPLPTLLAIPELARNAREWWRRCRRERHNVTPTQDWRFAVFDTWMIAWAVSATLAILASPHRAVRFALIFVPPVACLGGVFFARLWSRRWKRRTSARTVLVAAGVVATMTTVVRFSRWQRSASATTVELGPALINMIGHQDAMVVGEFAAQAVFETPYRHVYVRPGEFNDDPSTVEQLGVTHFVFVEDRTDFVERHLRRMRLPAYRDRKKLGTLRFREYTLGVWEVTGK